MKRIRWSLLMILPGRVQIETLQLASYGLLQCRWEESRVGGRTVGRCAFDGLSVCSRQQDVNRRGLWRIPVRQVQRWNSREGLERQRLGRWVRLLFLPLAWSKSRFLWLLRNRRHLVRPALSRDQLHLHIWARHFAEKPWPLRSLRTVFVWRLSRNSRWIPQFRQRPRHFWPEEDSTCTFVLVYRYAQQKWTGSILVFPILPH